MADHSHNRQFFELIPVGTKILNDTQADRADFTFGTTDTIKINEIKQRYGLNDAEYDLLATNMTPRAGQFGPQVFRPAITVDAQGSPSLKKESAFGYESVKSPSLRERKQGESNAIGDVRSLQTGTASNVLTGWQEKLCPVRKSRDADICRDCADEESVHEQQRLRENFVSALTTL